MSLSLTECEAVIHELASSITGGFIQKIHQPRPLMLTFDIHSPGQTCSLLACTEPTFARLHLTSQKFENPPTPPSFCAFLRSNLEGGRITAIRQEPRDRIAYITIVKAEQVFILVVALTGNQANMHLLNQEKIVLRSLRESRLKVGDRYLPPALKLDRPLDILPLLRQTRPPSPSGKEEFGDQYPVSATLDTRYEQQEFKEGQESVLEQQLTHVRKSLKQAKRKIHALQEDCKKVERYRNYARYGELLKSHLHEIKRGQESMTLVDYYDPALPTLTLPLDPSKDAVWNMENYFRKYHKFLGAQEHLQPRVDQTQQEIIRLEAQLAQLEQGIMDPEFLPKHPKTPKTSLPRDAGPPKGRQAPTQCYRTYTSADGLTIFVGKTAKDNDQLTLKVAKPDDLWLHARGTPGSHVIVRLEKGATVPPETLKDAATLTLWFSDLRKSGKGEVIYTLRKFVKKGKGFKPGAVMVEREKAIWIELKEDRLQRLKGLAT